MIFHGLGMDSTFMGVFTSREKAMDFINEAERVATEAGDQDHLFSLKQVQADELSTENALFVWVRIAADGSARSGATTYAEGTWYDGAEWLATGKTWREAYNAAEDERLDFLRASKWGDAVL